MATSLLSFSNELAALVETGAAPIVAVHGRPRFHSSGVHWSPSIVVTAEHTLRHDEDLFVTSGSGERLPAELVGREPGTDLAVLRVKDLSAPTVTKASQDSTRPGDLVIALGRNQASPNAALGIVSSMGGPSRTSRGGKLEQVIRLDLSLHPNAEGGAVLNASGEIIGIATPVLSRLAVFAVPNVTVERVTQALLQHGRLPKGYLGAGLQPVRLPAHVKEALALTADTGLMTVSVDESAAAGKAGLLIGDVLLEWDGHALDRPETLQPLLAEALGKPVFLRVLRGGQPVVLSVEVTERLGRK